MLLLFLAIFVVFLCGDFKIPSVSDTALITAVGVENAENGEYKCSFVIAKSNKGERENVVISTTAKTVAGGVELLESRYGLTPKLAYTSLVLVQEEVANGDIFNVISFFLNTNGVHDSAKLMISETPPSEVFSLDIETEKSGYDALEKVLSGADKIPLTLPMINLKDFAENYFSKGKDSAVPSVDIEKDGEFSSFNVGGGYLFSADKIAAKINGDTTFACNILLHNSKGASFTACEIPLENVTTDMRFAIVDASVKSQKKIEIGVAKLSFDVQLKVGILDQNNSCKTLAQVSGVGAEKEVISKAVSEFIKSDIEEALEIAKTQSADFLGVGEYFLLHDKSQFESMLEKNPNYLENANITVSVSTSVLQNYRL